MRLGVLLICSGVLSANDGLFVDQYQQLQKVYDVIVTEQGRVDYALLKRDAQLLAMLDGYVAALDEVNLMDVTGTEVKMAFFANAYNALTIKGVVDAWPVASVRDIKALFGFFTERKWIIGGRLHSLNQIEKQWLRPIDPGIHFLINCASESCPRLSKTVFLPENVATQMEALGRDFVLDTSKNKFDEQGVWHLSKIFDWYEKDFGGRDEVVAYIRKYKPDLDTPRKISFIKYDWTLNGPTGPGAP